MKIPRDASSVMVSMTIRTLLGNNRTSRSTFTCLRVRAHHANAGKIITTIMNSVISVVPVIGELNIRK